LGCVVSALFCGEKKRGGVNKNRRLMTQRQNLASSPPQTPREKSKNHARAKTELEAREMQIDVRFYYKECFFGDTSSILLSEKLKRAGGFAVCTDDS
jgi:hypothetical protein